MEQLSGHLPVIQNALFEESGCNDALLAKVSDTQRAQTQEKLQNRDPLVLDDETWRNPKPLE
jgi:hypothetical protein